MNDILFDCDTGHDDAIALMVALAHPEKLRVLGITTVAGNAPLEHVTRNTLAVLEYLGIDLDVSAGYAAPMVYPPEPQPGAHGESGMDGPCLPPPKKRPTPMHAMEYLRKTLLAAENKVTIVAVGPLTNIGMLLNTWPGLKEKIEKICIMGGSLCSGNILPKAEFNIYHDPHAARIVFRSGVPVVMSGIEVCESGSILLSEYPLFKNGGKASRLAYELLEFYSGYARERGLKSTPIFDMTTVIELLHPELFTWENHIVDVEVEGALCRGMTVADTRAPLCAARANTRVLTAVTGREAFIGVLKESLAVLDEACRRNAK